MWREWLTSARKTSRQQQNETKQNQEVKPTKQSNKVKHWKVQMFLEAVEVETATHTLTRNTAGKPELREQIHQQWFNQLLLPQSSNCTVAQSNTTPLNAK